MIIDAYSTCVWSGVCVLMGIKTAEIKVSLKILNGYELL